MVKKLILTTVLILFLIFPPIYPKSQIKGDVSNIKSYFGFVLTYFNENLQRESFFTYKVKGYEKRGIVLKNDAIQKSYIFSSDGDFLSEGEINGAIVIYFKSDKEPKKHYDSLKNFHLSYIFFQDGLNDFNLTPYLDLEKDEIFLEGDSILIKIGRENYKVRIKNVISLLKKEKIIGTVDASFDRIILYRGVK